jgi:PAS domain S-box-containing protein
MTSSRRTPRRISPTELLAFGLFEIAFIIAYRFGMSFTQTLAAPMWFPDSVLLCALLVTPPGKWPIYILGAAPIRLLLFVPPDTPLWFLAACFVNDSLKALLSAWLLRNISRPALWLDDLGKFTRYFLIAVILSPGLSAVAGAATRVFRGDSFPQAWTNWFLGDALASLILTPLLVRLDTEHQQFSWPNAARFARAFTIAAGLTLAIYVAFHRGLGGGAYPPFLLYIVVPFLLAAGVSFGLTGTTIALFALSLAAILATVAGKGPFYQASNAASLLSIQLFLFFLSVPFLFLSVLINQQRKTQRSLRESEERFRSMVDSAPVMVWMAGPDARCAFFNQPWLDFTGRPVDHDLQAAWRASVYPQDREQWSADYQSSFELRKAFTREYRMRRGDGAYRWVLENGSPRYGPNEEFLGYIGSCIDITDRKETEDRLRQMSAQLITAQETERFRIGQELHDDLSQRAAALSIGLKHLARRYEEGVRPPFEELHQQAIDLCRGISHVSHQLRPAALETLGLGAALKSLCDRSTTEAHTVRFGGAGALPPISDDVAISLYRVAQEALRNALTHSGAAKIDMALTVTESAIVLSVQDNGRGFAVNSVATTGLGLSGMGERMRHTGGNLIVVSTPGKGTTVEAAVPVARALRAGA